MNNITKLLFALLVAIMAPAMAQAQGWTKRTDHHFLESTSTMAATANGHVLVGLYRSSTDSIYHYFVSEVDSLGNELWYHAEPTVNSVLIKRVVVLSNGNITLLGLKYPAPNQSVTFLAQYSPAGTKLWEREYIPVTAGSGGYDLLLLPGDTLLIGGQANNTSLQPAETEVTLFKVNSQGDSLQYVVISDADTLGMALHKMVLGNNGNILALGNTGLELHFMNFDLSLNLLWSKAFLVDSTTFILPRDLIATSDGGYLTTGLNFRTGGAPLLLQAFLAKVDANGDSLWFKTYHYEGDASDGSSIVEPSPDKYTVSCISMRLVSGTTYGYSRPFLLFTDANGDMLRYKYYNGPSPSSVVDTKNLALLPDGGYLLSGSIGGGANYNDDLYLIRTDSLGNVYYGAIKGNVYDDDNANCELNTGEQTLARWLVTAMGNDTLYSTTDANGNYFMEADSGTYELHTVLAGSYWLDSICPDSLTVMVPNTGDTINRDIAIGKAVDCSELKVTMNTPFLRRCLAGPAYTVNYCNSGTALGANAYIELSLDTFLLVDSASIAYTDLGNNVFRFNVGDVAVNECGSFKVFIRVSCGFIAADQSYCVDAHIFPQTSCLPAGPTWDGARLDVTTDCQPDSLAFRIINNGNGMGAPRTYSIIQDDVMYATGNIQLGAGQSFTRKVPANGTTWTFVTSQTDGFPGNQRLVRSVEGCGVNNLGQFSLGFITAYPQTGPDQNGDMLCLVGRGSYDPNDKTPEPKGLGLEGLIDKEQTLTYSIRFQNTGTDTAFQVVIVDTLSDNLDLLSIRNVSASHPMTWTIKPGRVLVVTFANILLPDSNANEIASHGFVSFVIDLVDSLPNGTEITNTAYIYFDQNEAVVTNTTLNTIGELYKTWLTVSELNDPLDRVICYPNPTEGLLSIDLEGTVTEQVTFKVYDLSGRLVQQENLPAAAKHLVNLKLDSGMYLYEVYAGTERLGSGKLVMY